MSINKTIPTFFPELKLCSRVWHSLPQNFFSRESISPKNLFPSKTELGFLAPSKSAPIKTRIYRERNGEKCVMGVEQESFTHGSSEFCPIARANGFEYELNRLSKWLVVVFLAAAILWRHDVEAMWAALGFTLNAGLSTVLKQILNQERPLSTLRSDPGMPSSHAQAIFYAAMFANFSLVELLGVNAFTTTIVGFIFVLGSYLSWLRVSQQFHTISQVAVGAVVGSIFAILWFWWGNAIVFNAFFSYLWVQVIVVLGAAGYCVAFLIYII